jgi:hemerythrin
MLIEWEDIYSVGIEEFDNDHKKLIELINRLHQAMLDKKAKEVLGEIINELVDYTIYHFNKEEAMFDAKGYSKSDEHKEKHSSLVSRVAQLKEDFESNKIALSMETLKFLQDWLMEHIVKEDKQYRYELS